MSKDHHHQASRHQTGEVILTPFPKRSRDRRRRAWRAVYDHRCPQQYRAKRRKAGWHQNFRDPHPSPPLSQGLHLSLAPVLFEQFAQLRPLCLVTWMVSVLSCSSLCLSHLAHLGKKTNLMRKGGRGGVRVSSSAPASQVQSYSLPPYNLH